MASVDLPLPAGPSNGVRPVLQPSAQQVVELGIAGCEQPARLAVVMFGGDQSGKNVEAAPFDEVMVRR